MRWSPLIGGAPDQCVATGAHGPLSASCDAPRGIVAIGRCGRMRDRVVSLACAPGRSQPKGGKPPCRIFPVAHPFASRIQLRPPGSRVSACNPCGAVSAATRRAGGDTQGVLSAGLRGATSQPLRVTSAGRSSSLYSLGCWELSGALAEVVTPQRRTASRHHLRERLTIRMVRHSVIAQAMQMTVRERSPMWTASPAR